LSSHCFEGVKQGRWCKVLRRATWKQSVEHKQLFHGIVFTEKNMGDFRPIGQNTSYERKFTAFKVRAMFFLVFIQ